MKYCVFCVAAGLAAASYGWGLDSALKAVDKATSTVNGANESLKSTAQKVEDVTKSPQTATAQAQASAVIDSSAAATASPATVESKAEAAVSALQWDAAGYSAKLAKVNEAMPNVMKKMPLRGDVEMWYNAAYQLTTIDKQYSFLPPAQRVTRVNPNAQGNVDKFLAWVEGGMQASAAANQPPVGAPSAPSGYGQQTSCANVQAEASQANVGGELPPPTGAPAVPAGYDHSPSCVTASGAQPHSGPSGKVSTDDDDPIVGGSQVYDVMRDVDDVVATAKKLGYAVSWPEWVKSESSYKGKRRSEIKKMKAEIQALFADAEQKAKEVANETRKKKLDERKALVSRCDAYAARFENDCEVCKKAVADFVKKYPMYLGDSKYKDGFECSAMYNTDVKNFLDDKLSGKYDKDAEGEELDQQLKWLRKYAGLESAESHACGGRGGRIKSSESAGSHARDGRGGRSESSSTNSVLASVSSPELRSATEECLRELDEYVGGKIVNTAIQRLECAVANKQVSQDFSEKISGARNVASKSALKAEELLKAVELEIETNKKLAAERDALIKKLVAADVALWTTDILKIEKGEKRNAVLADALKGKFGSEAAEGTDASGLRALINKLYSRDEQRELISDYKTPIALVVAIAGSIDDEELRRVLLVDDTKWALDILRADASREDNQYAYVTLLSHEANVDVLMSVYERQDRVNFTYEKMTKPKGEMSAGDMLKKMWTDQENSNGRGYGRLGVWMLDNCGKTFCERVSRLASARRKAAEKQTFLMKDFYLGMPHRDFKLISKVWNDKKGRVTARFGTFNNGTLSEISFGAKARHEYLGIKKDGLTGLGMFVAKYIPGGMENVGELKVGAKADLGYDPENPEVEIKTWWYTDCPKYECQIRMYDSGTICVVSTSDDDSPKLDFSGLD